MPELSSEMIGQMTAVLKLAVLPAMGTAAVVMAAILLSCGVKQAPLSAALGLLAGSALGVQLSCDSLYLMPGSSSWNWLFASAVAATWVGRIARMPDFQPAACWFLRAAMAILIAWTVIPPDSRKDVDWLAPAFAVIVFAHWTILERLTVELSDGSVPFCLSFVFIAIGVVLIHANTSSLMNVALAIAGALAGLGAVAWWGRADSGGAIPATAVMAPGLLLMGHQTTYSDIPWYGFALPTIAPLLLAEVLPLNQWQGTRWQLRRFGLMLLLVLIPLGITFYLADKYAPLEDPFATP